MKKLLKIISVLFLLTFSGTHLFAQEETGSEKSLVNSSAIGISSMFWHNNYSAGLNYQHWFDNGFGLSFTAGGRTYSTYNYDSDTDEAWSVKDIHYAVTAELQYNVCTTPQDKPFCAIFYTWLLGGAEGMTDSSYNFINNACAGFGIGTELIFWNRMSIPLEFGFAGAFPTDTAVSICGGIGLKFRL